MNIEKYPNAIVEVFNRNGQGYSQKPTIKTIGRAISKEVDFRGDPIITTSTFLTKAKSSAGGSSLLTDLKPKQKAPPISLFESDPNGLCQ